MGHKFETDLPVRKRAILPFSIKQMSLTQQKLLPMAKEEEHEEHEAVVTPPHLTPIHTSPCTRSDAAYLLSVDPPTCIAVLELARDKEEEEGDIQEDDILDCHLRRVHLPLIRTTLKFGRGTCPSPSVREFVRNMVDGMMNTYAMVCLVARAYHGAYVTYCPSLVAWRLHLTAQTLPTKGCFALCASKNAPPLSL